MYSITKRIPISFSCINHRLSHITLLYVITSFWIIGCKNNHLSELYKNVRESSGDGPVLVKSGENQIRQSGGSFARDNYTVLTAAEMTELPLNSRRLALTALMLRKLAIEDGLNNGLFDTPEARAFILPRLEKAMEDYYYYKLSEEKVWAERIRSVKKDKPAIEAFIKNDPALRKRQKSPTDFSESINNAIERIISEKRISEYSRIKQTILTNNPPIEVVQ